MSSDRWIAIGDIHGCADELESLIEQLPIDDNTHLVFLGDYVDRGPNSKKVIQMVIDLKKRCDVIALKGNHEAMMLDFLKDPSSVSAGLFILNGGSATLASYSTGSEKFHIPDDHLEFLESLKFYHETDDYFFVHAGVPDVPLNKIDIKKHSLDLIWIRSAFHTSTFQWDKVIVHGHTVVEQVEMLENRINLDTGCVFQGRLSALDLSDRQLYQVSARPHMPRVFLRDALRYSRVATRFVGSVPVFIHDDEGVHPFETLNYNEFGLLIHTLKSREKRFEVGDIIEGVIGSVDVQQVTFKGEVVRTQRKNDDLFYGVKMLGPLLPKADQ